MRPTWRVRFGNSGGWCASAVSLRSRRGRQKLFEPANSAFWEAIRAERPDLHKSSNPWDTINDAASLKQLLRRSGVETTDVEYESGEHPLGSPEDWWTIVMGSGYRGTVDKLDPAARERVREATLRPLREKNVRAIRTDVVYAAAQKPGG